MATALMIAFSITSCEDDDDPDPVVQDELSDFMKIGEQQLTGMKVALYMMEDPYVGYNQVAVRVMEDGSDEVEEDASVDFLPMMDMGSMMHSTPHEDPVYRQDLRAYMGTSTFIMPGGTAGQWTFHVIASLPGMTADTASFDIDVMDKAETRLYQFVSAEDSTTAYFVALRNPMEPKVGMNDFELMIYERENMMSFPPAQDLQIEMTPEMPSMGHGSPNNEDPTMVLNGYYAGKVNFTMSGHWKVNLVIKDANGNMLDDDGYFDITFQ